MNRLLYALMLVGGLSLISCEHKELCYDHSHTTDVRVVFDWTKAPGASPETMRLYLFPMDGGNVLPYEFTDYRGGHIPVPVGRYKVLCVNSDTESILYRNMGSFDTFEAYASEGVLNAKSSSVPRAEGTHDERIVKSSDRLYAARLDEVTITFSDESPVITLFPDVSVCHYRVEIRNVSNLEYISQSGISGSLSGMSGGLFVGRDELTPELVTIPFQVVSDGISVLRADFLTFGQLDAGRSSHKLVVYVIMADGSKNYYTFDVNAQVRKASNPKEVYILLDGLPLPKPIANGGGFQPSVDEWQEEHVDVSM